MNIYDDIILDLYLKGRLPEQQQTALEADLAKDPDLQKRLEAHRKMASVIRTSARHKLQNKLQILENKYKKASIEPTYTLDELLEMFGVVEHYDMVIADMDTALVARSRHIKVLEPQNGEAIHDTLLFMFAEAMPKGITLVIENSLEEEIDKIQMVLGQTFFKKNITGWKPGRYYWKLFGQQIDTVMGTFFIRKDLMPQ